MEIREIKNQKPRIALILDMWFPYVSGQQTHVAKLAEYLVKEEGYEVDLYTRALKGKLNADEKAFEKMEGLRLIRTGFPTGPRNFLMRLWFLASTAIRLSWSGRRYTLMHAHSAVGAMAMKMSSWFNQVPTLVTVHENQVFNKRWTLKKAFHRVMFLETKYHQVISTSEELLKAVNVNENILVIPDGIDPAPYETAGPAKGSASKVGGASDRFEVLYQGSLEWHKGVDVLLESVKLLIDSSAFIQTKKDFLLHLVGQGSMARALKKHVDRLGIAHYVRFHPKLSQSKLIELFKSVDLFVMPSRSDALPHALLRACAARLPILATDVGDHRKVILDNQNGHLVHEGDPKEMAYYLEYYSLNPQLKKMGDLGFDLVTQEYPWENCLKKNRRAYERIRVTPRKQRYPFWKVPGLLLKRRQFETEYRGKDALQFCLTVNVEQVPSGKELANEVAHVTPFLSHFSNFCETLEIPSTIFFQSDVLFHHLEEVRELQKAGHEIGIKISEHEWQQVNKRKACVRQLREKLTEAGLKSVHMLRAPVDLSEEELRMIHEYAFENLPVSEDPMPHIGLKYGVLPLGKVVSMNLENWSDLNDDELLATVNRLRNEQKKNGVPSFVIFEASSWEFQALPGLSYTGGENFTALSKKLNFLSKQTKMEFQTLSQFCKSCIKSAR